MALANCCYKGSGAQLVDGRQRFCKLSNMSVTTLSKAFFQLIDKSVGPFDRLFAFRPFPFEAGGALNFLTVGAGREQFVTYVSWDLFGHEKLKRGKLGRCELLAVCASEQWCLDVVTNIGRQMLEEVFDPGDTMDISAWGAPFGLEGIVFEAAFSTQIRNVLRREKCGLLRCIGITQAELEFARSQGAEALVERLKRAGVYPKTVLNRPTIDLSPA